MVGTTPRLLSYLRFPLRPRIRLTTYCNRRCSYCFAEDYLSTEPDKRDLKIDEVEYILQACAKEGIPLLGWQGGEPLLHPNLDRIADLHRQYDVKAMIFTNALVPTEKLRYLQGITQSVLINCNTPDTYTAEELELLDENIQYLISILGREKVAVGINIYDHEMDTGYIVDLALRHDLYEVRVDITRPAPSGHNQHTEFEEVTRMFKKARNTVELLNSNGILMAHFDCPFPLCKLSSDDRDFVWEHFYDGEKYGRCRSGLDITPGLKISSCFCSIPFKDISLRDFDSLWHAWLVIHSIEDGLRWQNTATTACARCDFHLRQICQGGCLGYKFGKEEMIDSSTLINYCDAHTDQLNRELAAAYKFFFTGEYEEAWGILQSIKEINKEKRVLYLYGLASICINRVDEAQKTFEYLIENEPFPAVIAFEAGAFLQAFGYKEEALHVMELALAAKHPAPRECYNLHRGLAALYHHFDRKELATHHMSLAVEMGPETWKRRLAK